MPRTKEQLRKIKQSTKNNILKTALELFGKNGYHGTSMGDIAQKAGVSKGLAYNYFDSKEHLVEEVIALLLAKVEYSLTELNKIKDPYKKIKFFIEETFLLLKQDFDFWILYMNFAIQPEIKEITQKVLGNYIEDIFKLIEDMLRDAGMKNARKEAKIFGAIIDGIGFHYSLNPEKYDLDEMVKFFVQKYSKRNLSKEKKIN